AGGEVEVDLRGVRSEQSHRTLVEVAVELAVGVAPDATVRRVGRLSGDSGDLDRLGVRPDAVVVAAAEQRRAIRDQAIELAAVRCAVGEEFGRPARAEHPGVIWML